MSRHSTLMLSIVLLGPGLSVDWMAIDSWRGDVETHTVRAHPPEQNPPSKGDATSIPRAAARPDRRRADIDTGWALIQRGDYRGAIQTFNKAKDGSSQDPRVFLGLGLSHYRLAQFDPAIENLKRALRLDGALEQAHTLLGDVAFMRDQLANAVRHYESALTLNPNDVSIQDGLFSVRRAQQFEAGFARIVTPHFIVKCHEAQRMGLKGLADRLEGLYERIGERLQHRPKEKIIVVLYSDGVFQEFTDSPSWAGGLFDGKIHLAVRRVLHASSEADATLAHEYAHALVHRLAGGRAPTWLDEGLALYFEGRTPSWSDTILDRPQTELTPLHALHGSFLSLPPREATLAYAESLSATRVLIHRYGWSRVRRLLETLAQTDEFSAAFETALKEPYHVFEASWAAAQRHRSL
ncbi:MAG: tetratricopeptide repeat protein [Nitrospirales bacterium]|nr:tetratricopeptide repeat protein [Nitrospirales bacterium]